jgi:hypothetical protein
MAVKLTTLSKILIVLAVMAILFFVLQKYIPQLSEKSTSDEIKTEVADQKTVAEENTVENAQTKPETSVKFNYVAPVPENGKLKGVVELGASGFNSFIISIDKNKTWELKKAEYGNSLVYENMASNEDVRDGLKKYIGKILDFGVKGKDIHFVVSSGAQKVESTQKISNELKKMGYFVNQVTPEQEAKYALKSVLPKEFMSSAFVVDIGSGNTKLSWIDNNGSTKGIDTYGAKYYVDNIADEIVSKAVSLKSKQIPADRTKNCFIIGGIPFELAKQLRKDKERYTVIGNPDFYKADGAKMKSGLNIYKTIKETTKCETFVFDWDANFTIGFLLTLN